MKICTFFGHRDTPEKAADKLKEIITYLIEQKNINCFYVGNNGNFDKIVLSVLKELSIKYPKIKYYVVLAYLNNCENEVNTIFPEGIENVPKRFAINFRNKWMINNSDIAVVYIDHSYGGAAQFAEMAKRNGLEIINIYK